MGHRVCKIHHKKNKTVFVDHCILANTLWSRLVGLLNKKNLSSNEGLLLKPCNQVHTLFMSFPMDAVFLDVNNKILGIREMQPWQISKIFFNAKQVLELPLGTCRLKGVVPGDELEIVL